jgi:hypothetical protein
MWPVIGSVVFKTTFSGSRGIEMKTTQNYSVALNE